MIDGTFTEVEDGVLVELLDQWAQDLPKPHRKPKHTQENYSKLIPIVQLVGLVGCNEPKHI